MTATTPNGEVTTVGLKNVALSKDGDRGWCRLAAMDVDESWFSRPTVALVKHAFHKAR